MSTQVACALRAARVLAGGRERRGWWVSVRGDRVVEVAPRPVAGACPIDLGDVDLVPGLIDLHSDCVEGKAHPRSATELPLASALLDLDTEVASWGITTHFLCVALEDDLGKFRSLARAREIMAALGDLGPDLRVDHRAHLRVDVTGDGIPLARDLAGGGTVGLLSYMVHLPGRGQFPDEESWRAQYANSYGPHDELGRRRERRVHRLAAASEGQRAVAGIARAAGAALASHDDDSAEAVDEARTLGVDVSEFPVNAAAARGARDAGIGVLMGAPNARRGRSHYGNLSAREALEGGWLSALASDYHPPSLLAAAYGLADDRLCSWPEALALVTAAPARLAGLTDRGAIEPGLRADLVAVGRRGGLPSVCGVWVGGRRVVG